MVDIKLLGIVVALTLIVQTIYTIIQRKTSNKKKKTITKSQLEKKKEESRERILKNKTFDKTSNENNKKIPVISKKDLLKQGKAGNQKKKWVAPNSVLFYKAVKNLPDNVLWFDISKNQKTIVVSTKSKTIYIFFQQKIQSNSDKNDSHEYVSFEVESPPDKVAISEKGTYVVVSFNNKIEVYERKGKNYNYKSEIKGEHLMDTLDMYISEELNYIATVGNGEEKFLVAWDLSGNKLGRQNTLLTDHRNCSIEKQNGRITIGTWSSDVLIFKVNIDKHNLKYQSFKKVMSATGHKSGIMGSSFTENGDNLISVSKDGTIKEWDLCVNGTQASCLNTYKHDLVNDRSASNQGLLIKYVTIKDRKQMLIVGTSIEIYELEDSQTKKVSKIDNAHNGEKIEKAMIISKEGKTMEEDDTVYLVTISSAKVCVWDLLRLNQ